MNPRHERLRRLLHGAGVVAVNAVFQPVAAEIGLHAAHQQDSVEAVVRGRFHIEAHRGLNPIILPAIVAALQSDEAGAIGMVGARLGNVPPVST